MLKWKHFQLPVALTWMCSSVGSTALLRAHAFSFSFFKTMFPLLLTYQIEFLELKCLFN